MHERVGFILKAPIRFNPRALATARRIDPALIADIDTYRQWWDAELTMDEAAMLLGGIKPHEREEHDDDSWVEGFERLAATLRSAAATGELPEHPSLPRLVAWAERAARDLPPELEACVHEHAECASAASATPRPGQREATRFIISVIEKFVCSHEKPARAAGEPFDRKQMPGTKNELADLVNSVLPERYRRKRATLHDYFKHMGLRWPTHARGGGLRELRTRLGLHTGGLGDVGVGNSHPI